MKTHNLWRQMQAALSTLHLADKCLLIFMGILLFQSAYNIFFHGVAAHGNDTLDIIIRTTAAAIFGYFISANFQNGTKSAVQNEQNKRDSLTLDASSTDGKPMGRIGFSAKTDALELPTENTGISFENKPKCRNHLQILVIACIGLFSLITLIIFRNYAVLNAVATATLSQLRDFVSGSVGFLIGHSTHEGKD